MGADVDNRRRKCQINISVNFSMKAEIIYILSVLLFALDLM